MLAAARIVIAGNRFTSTGMGAEYKGTVKLDPRKTPRHINMKFDAGPEKGNTNLGIYEFDGDRLRICLATRGDVRPSHFASAPGSGIAIETLARESTAARGKSKTQKVRPAKTTTGTNEFEGEWTMVSGVMNGQAMDASMVKWVRRVFDGNQTTVTTGPQVMLKVEFRADAFASPKRIDYMNLAGAHKGKKQLGIYEFAGDLLKVCIAAPGAARPARFKSARGDGARSLCGNALDAAQTTEAQRA